MALSISDFNIISSLNTAASTSVSGVNFNIWGNNSINRLGSIDPNAPTYAIVHGWNNTGGNAGNNYKPNDWMANQAQTFRERESNANIILVDWEEGARNPLYFPSAERTDDVGDRLATYLRNSSVDPNYTTIIGHSLGAHIAGFAGSAYRQFTGRSLSQIVGLDPAGPAFEGKPVQDRLDPTDATRVVSFHTSKILGYDDRLATLDVYANWNDWFQPGQSSFIGNHGYATTLFTELLQGNSFTQFNGSLFNLNTVVNAGFTGVNNAGTKNNKSVVPLNLLGTANNDNLAGGATNDNIRGDAGNDKITGGDGNDALFGESGNDILNGGRGNDSVFGGVGGDRLFGDGGNDILYGGRDRDSVFGGVGGDRLFGDQGDDVLMGADASLGKGFGEIDTLTGGAGSDRFVLGAAGEAFYNDDSISTSGIGDYALIADFDVLEDTIQLFGSKSSYTLGVSPTGLAAGTAIFLNESVLELIAIVQGSTNLNLSDNYFVTV